MQQESASFELKLGHNGQAINAVSLYTARYCLLIVRTTRLAIPEYIVSSTCNPRFLLLKYNIHFAISQDFNYLM